jgi:uncharacterized membrane protein
MTSLRNLQLGLAGAVASAFLAAAFASETAATFDIVFDNPSPLYGPTQTLVGCSADGSALAGNDQNLYGGSNWFSHPFRLTDGVTEDLGFLAGLTSTSGGYANAISSDGLVIVGRATATPGGNPFLPDDPSDTVTQGGAFRWTSATGMQPLFDPPHRTSTATDVSADGSIIVGTDQFAAGPGPGDYLSARGFRWTPGGTTVLEPLSGYTGSSATAVSDDGAITVGASHGANQASQACLWTANGSVTGLGYLPADDSIVFHLEIRSIATNISADGTTVIGTSTTTYPSNDYVGTSRMHGFRWTADGGMQDLGGVIPRVLSADGSVIAADDNGTAYRWDAGHGLQNLRTLLIAAGADLHGKRLTGIIAISADGKTFYGTGYHDIDIDYTGGSIGVIITSGSRGTFMWRATLPFVPDLTVKMPSPSSSPTVLAPPTINRKIKTTTSRTMGHKVVIRGTAAGTISKVTYRIGHRRFTKPARGTHNWRLTVRLEPGRNVVMITAHGPGGDSAPVKAVVIRH